MLAFAAMLSDKGRGQVFGLYGAIGVAAIGTVFFDYLTGHSFDAALTHSAPYAAAAFLVSAALSLVLPRTAVADEYAEA